MEEQIFLFPLSVEKLCTEFVWNMNSFACYLFWMYWGKVQMYHFTFFWHQKFPPMLLSLSYPRRQASAPVGM